MADYSERSPYWWNLPTMLEEIRAREAREPVEEATRLKLESMRRQAEEEKARQEILQQWLNPPTFTYGESREPVDVGRFSVGGAPMEDVAVGPGGIRPVTGKVQPTGITAPDVLAKKEMAQRALLGIPMGGELPMERQKRELLHAKEVEERQVKIEAMREEARAALKKEEFRIRNEQAMEVIREKERLRGERAEPMKIGATEENIKQRVATEGVESLTPGELEIWNRMDKSSKDAVRIAAQNPMFQAATPDERREMVNEITDLIRIQRQTGGPTSEDTERIARLTEKFGPPSMHRGRMAIIDGKYAYRSNGVEWLPAPMPKGK